MATFGWTEWGAPGSITYANRIGYTTGGTAFICPTPGIAQSITFNYMSWTPGTYKVKCAIYTEDKIFIDETEERVMGYTNGVYFSETWDFLPPKPHVNGNTYYILASWFEDSARVAHEAQVGYTHRYDSETYGPVWPSPLSIDFTSADFVLQIYCIYDEYLGLGLKPSLVCCKGAVGRPAMGTGGASFGG